MRLNFWKSILTGIFCICAIALNAQNVPNKYCKELVELAEEGNDDAQLLLGDLYYDGDGVGRDYREAAKWYQKASDKGNMEARYALAECYELGTGKPQDLEKAISLYEEIVDEIGYGDEEGLSEDSLEKIKKLNMALAERYLPAAKKGDPVAQYKVGRCYYNAMEKTPTEVAKWIRKAADKELTDAQTFLAWLYEIGYGVDQNHKEASKLYHVAAAKGNTDAQYYLGLNYFSGDLVEKDVAKGRSFMEKSAKNGNPFALTLCGLAYYQGGYELITEELHVNIDFDIDYRKAMEYLTKALEHPDLDSSAKGEIARKLSACYRFGRGVKADEEIADKYMKEAEDFGDFSAAVVNSWLRRP